MNSSTAATNRLNALLRWSFLLLYVVLGVVLFLHHEPWRDEAENWLMAGGVGLYDTWRYGRYSGTPVLWFLLLMPFAKAGLSFAWQGIIHLLLASAAAAVLLWRSPFPNYIRLPIIFSFFLSYQYLAIARSYIVTILLLFLIASVYPRRLQRPWLYGLLVALVANTNTHSIFAAAVLFLLFVWDAFAQKRLAKPQWVGIGFMVVGGALALFQVWPPSDGQYGRLLAKVDYGAIHRMIAAAFVPKQPDALGLPAGLVVLCLALFSWLTKPRVLVFFTTVWVWCASVLVFVWNGGLRHYGLFFVFFVFAYWISHYEEGIASRSPFVMSIKRLGQKYAAAALRMAFAVCLAASCWSAVATWLDEIAYPFSGAEQMGKFIKDHRFEDHTIAAHQEPHCAAVLAHLEDREFWYAATQRYGSYMLWDKQYVRGLRVSNAEALRRIMAQFPSGADEKLLVLLNSRLRNPDGAGLRLVFQSDAKRGFTRGGETFFLYEPVRSQTREP